MLTIADVLPGSVSNGSGGKRLAGKKNAVQLNVEISTDLIHVESMWKNVLV